MGCWTLETGGSGPQVLHGPPYNAEATEAQRGQGSQGQGHTTSQGMPMKSGVRHLSASLALVRSLVGYYSLLPPTTERL